MKIYMEIKFSKKGLKLPLELYILLQFSIVFYK